MRAAAVSSRGRCAGARTLFRTRARGVWVALLADVDACTTLMRTLEEALAQPHASARGFVEGGAIGCPLCFDGASRAALGPPRLWGGQRALA